MEDLTPLVRKIISDLRKTGCSGHKISKLTGVNLRTINNFLKRVKERGNEENLPRTGRRIKTDSRADHRLFRIVRENRRQTLEDLATKFNNISVENISSRTVRRRLFENQYKRHVVSKKITIKRENRFL